jgi:hypothetical protein
MATHELRSIDWDDGSSDEEEEDIGPKEGVCLLSLRIILDICKSKITASVPKKLQRQMQTMQVS